MPNNTPRIHILPEDLCNKIAAGEVVERPSSVVKELIENSLDAGATDIHIDLGNGGKTLVRISDNGCGMNRQDALLCVERHATSKISRDEDLFALKTLGFRGEALASIASVARMSLKTCNNADGLGCHIRIEGGKIKGVEEIGLPIGTIIEVRNLFFNLPARKKFLRKDETEFGHAADVVSKQALAHPEVAFRLTHNERLILDLRREKGLVERFAALLGRSLIKDMLTLAGSGTEALFLKGLISQPHLNRSAPSHIYTFINGRYIRDRVVQHAVMEGYRGVLMKGRYPVVALFLTIDPALVDVNVHPTKHEVRFRHQAQVHDFIVSVVSRLLKPATWLSGHDHQSPVNQFEKRQPFTQRTAIVWDSPPQAPLFVREQADPLPPVIAGSRNDAGAVVDDPHAPARSDRSIADDPESQPSVIIPHREGFFSSLLILGQFHQSYILCQHQDDLLLIDQHAAHERVRFEQLKECYFEQGRIVGQQLLFPEILELDYNSAAALSEHLGEMRRLGFDIEPFGGKSFAVKAVPALLADHRPQELVIDVALELERVGSRGGLKESIEQVLVLMACHQSVRANQTLSTPEIKALLAALDRIDFKANCPHGRPVSARLTLHEVERLFRRHG